MKKKESKNNDFYYKYMNKPFVISKLIKKPIILKELNTIENITRTTLKGYLRLNYNNIVNIFGFPNYGPSADGKCDWEWGFFLRKEPLHIYNYNINYCKKNKNIKPEDLKYWNIGGNTYKILDLLYNYIIQRDSKYLNQTLIYG